MPAPKGNKHALGCTTSGKPSKYSDEFRKQQFKDLLEWSKHPNNHNLLDFVFDKEYILSTLREWTIDNVEFATSYIKAKERLGSNIRKQLHDKEKPYNPGAFHREIGLYDSELHLHEEASKDREARRKRDIQQSNGLTPEEIEKYINKKLNEKH